MRARAPQRPAMRGGRPGMGGRGGIIKVARNEFLILSLLLPYLAMVLGMVLMLLLAIATRIYIGIDHKWVDGDAVR